MIEDKQILIELERLAAAFPWQQVQIDAYRDPDGSMHWGAACGNNSELALPFEYCSAATLPEAVDKMIAQYSQKHDPQKRRDEKIAALKEQIRKLEAVRLLFPPYVPNRELAQFCQRPAVVEIQSEPVKDDVAF